MIQNCSAARDPSPQVIESDADPGTVTPAAGACESNVVCTQRVAAHTYERVVKRHA